MTRHRNITRIDYGRGRAWWVRFQRGASGRPGREVISRHFADSTYGGKRKALAAAKKWRDRTARRVPPPAKNRNRVKAEPGYGYVKRTTIMRRAGSSDVWLAWIRLDGGRSASTSASVERWGERGARERAKAYLARKRKELRRAP